MDLSVLGKIPPQSIEAEQSVLGCMILDKEVIEDVFEIISPEDIFREDNKKVFEAIRTLYNIREPVDIITVSDQLHRDGVLEMCGGMEYLTELTAKVPTTTNARHYAEIVQEKSNYRKLIRIGEAIKSHSFEGASEAYDIIQKAMDHMKEIKQAQNVTNGYVPEILADVIEDIEKNASRGKMSGTPTGLSEMDKYTAGWHEARLYLLGARPKMGKTSLFCQLADLASEHFPVVIFSLEMLKVDIIKMLLYQNARVDGMAEQQGRITDEDWTCIAEASSAMYNRNLYIDDESRSMPEIVSSLRRIQKEFEKRGKGKIGMVVIDYIQLIKGDKRQQRNYQLEDISHTLNDIKKDYRCTVLAMAQLSREVERRSDCRPLPSDLRDCGALEQDCDGLFLMYRDAYYNGRNSENTRWYTIGQKKVCADIVELNMFMNRHGPAGVMKLDMLTQYRLFIERPKTAESPTKEEAQKAEETLEQADMFEGGKKYGGSKGKRNSHDEFPG